MRSASSNTPSASRRNQRGAPCSSTFPRGLSSAAPGRRSVPSWMRSSSSPPVPCSRRSVGASGIAGGTKRWTKPRSSRSIIGVSIQQRAEAQPFPQETELADVISLMKREQRERAAQRLVRARDAWGRGGTELFGSQAAKPLHQLLGLFLPHRQDRVGIRKRRKVAHDRSGLEQSLPRHIGGTAEDGDDARSH